MFFTVPIIKLRTFGGYISVIGASAKGIKLRLSVFALYFLISQIKKVWKFILIRFGNSFQSHVNEDMPFPVTLHQTLIESGG